MPDGALVAITGGKDVSAPDAVYRSLDKVRAKYGDMVLVHGGDSGVEKIAAHWAERNDVHQIVCKPDWQRHGRAALFRHNDELLNLLPKGVIAFPGSGITGNLVDKAASMGIHVMKQYLAIACCTAPEQPGKNTPVTCPTSGGSLELGVLLCLAPLLMRYSS
ncbi:MAG: DUF2493 domain-containing protein [Gammaproteobacteria bacterium]|nr:DUF2493 domain-containing protein [Gammaproteobacteria bacterium]MYL00984.1 DUF2493 domain-containing protein [Gammaproteobacteria bacterium]